MTNILLSLLIALLAPPFALNAVAQLQPSTYSIPAELRQLAAPFMGKQVQLPRVTDDDRYVFADIVATQRASLQGRAKQKDDYEFGLASACFPIPNWPKPPPPPPPPPPPTNSPPGQPARGRGQLENRRLSIGDFAQAALQAPNANAYQRLANLMAGIATDQAKQMELRRVLKKEVLVLDQGALKERNLTVMDIY
jgi:hypothetical protein